jgi:hemolysin activation/secretion protein
MFTSTRVAILAALVVVFAGLWFLWQSSAKENKALIKENATQGVVIGLQLDTSIKTEASRAVNEDTAVAIQTAEKKVEARQSSIEKKVQLKLDTLERGFQAAPQASAERERDQQVAQVQIDGLWDSFCSVSPSAQGCTPATDPTATAGKPAPKRALETATA